MESSKYPIDYFEHNGFKEIDVTIIRGGQAMAEQSFISAPFKALKSNCAIVFKQNDNLYSQLKRDYESSIRQAKKLMEQGINSIIYIFTDYPNIVKHHIVSENPFVIPEYDGKGQTFVKDVKNIDTIDPFNPTNN